MSVLPYPPAPELGWYDDDLMEVGNPSIARGDSVSTGSFHNISEQEEDVQDWDGTLLSTAFTTKHPHVAYRLHNDVTGQDELIDHSVLLGRKPSGNLPEGAKAIILEDPTRTISRNHAAISFDQDEVLWIEDYGSLNGTFVISGFQETQVTKGTPVRLHAPATLRIGDQFFRFEEEL